MKDLVRFFASLSLAFIISVCAQETGQIEPVSSLKTGADLLFEKHLDQISNENIAIVTNHTGLLSNGTHIVDSLLSLPNIFLKKVFTPEHGFKGTHSAGELVDEKAESKFELISLYGKNKKPTKENLENIDLVIFDIQDIGVRFYTYISTLYYILEACAENNVEVIVLDRPNPISTIDVSGPISGKNFLSFISIAPIPIIHQMTIGEIANLFNNEFLQTKKKAEISIIKVSGWNREQPWTFYNQKWIKPSPNIPDYETALLYPMNCFVEGLNISEGRGTLTPFKVIGAPFINSKLLLDELKRQNLRGLEIEEVEFTPVVIPDMAKYPKYKNEKCFGIKFKISDLNEYKPIINAVTILRTLNNLFRENLEFRQKHFDLLWGNDDLRNALQSNKELEFLKGLTKTNDNFIIQRHKYLLY